jgi:predicted metalloprotease with PDZ domain
MLQLSRTCAVILILVTSSLLAFSSAPTGGYRFLIDLENVNDDRVSVEAFCPSVTENTINFCLPKIVPGTYSIYDFGRFIDDFSAYDKDGNALKWTSKDSNTWTIQDATKLNRITYKVNDSFDAYGKGNPIFEPAGSNIQRDTNYLINSFAYVGFFESQTELPYILNVKHKPGFYGGTALIDQDPSSTMDEYRFPDYHELADNPIMYAAADTASVMVGATQVLISLYSPNKTISAKFLAGQLDTLLQAQGKYLGGKLPVNKYAFIIYLTEKDGGISGGVGALEHSYSSVYFMPEVPPEQFAAKFRDFASHEFFHIVTPLNIHSKEIQYFDFSNPKMSEHLWLYEGTTEYHAHQVQVKYNLISREEYLDVLRGKISISRQYFNDTVPFTVMSTNILDQYKDEFFNVYQKGALIGMCLDLKLLSLSNGRYGIQKLIADLSSYYGKGRPFEDDELFNKIAEVSHYPEIRAFFSKYVEGNTPIPMRIFSNLPVCNYLPLCQKKNSHLAEL